MRHRKRSQRLSRRTAHRQATVRNLVINLLNYQKIKTTRAKAKVAQSTLGRLISLGRKDTLQARRHAYRILDDRSAVQQLFSKIAPLFKSKSSGFSRIVYYCRRQGDGAQLVFLELTEKLPEVKRTKPKKEQPKEEKPTAVKPEQLEQEDKAKPKIVQKKPRPAKEIKPKKFLGGLRRLFKKERDSL